MNPAPPQADETTIEWATVLSDRPPGEYPRVVNLFTFEPGRTGYVLATPELHLHCDQCGGSRTFACEDRPYPSANAYLLIYQCRNCLKSVVWFAVMAGRVDEATGNAVKFGQWPWYGPPVPPRLIKLIGPDWGLFQKGQRDETDGRGIGAFARASAH